MIIIIGTLSAVLQCLLYAVLGSFLIWLYRRLPLRSIPWLGAYILLTLPPLHWLNTALVHYLLHPGSNFGSLTGAWLTNSSSMTLFAAGQVVNALIRLLLAVMILGDAVFVLSKAGVEPDRKGVRMLLLAREFSTSLGVTVIVLTVCIQATVIFRIF